jgi:hypothetical protein
VVTKAAASNTAAAAQNIPAKTIFMVSKLMNRAEAVNQPYPGVSFLKTARSKRINVVARIVPLHGGDKRNGLAEIDQPAQDLPGFTSSWCVRSSVLR